MAEAGKPTQRVLERRVSALGVSFLLLFVAYSAAQLLQTTVRGSAGYVSLFTIYTCFAASALCSPWLVARFGAAKLLAPAAVPYVVFTASFLLPAWLAVPSAAGVGFGAGPLWSAQASWVGEAASAYAGVTGLALTDAASALNTRFYAIFASAGALSNLFASVIMSAVEGPTAISLLFTVLTVVGAAAAGLLACLPEAADSSASVLRLPAWAHSEGARKALASGGAAGAAGAGAVEGEGSSAAVAARETESLSASPPRPPPPTPLAMLRFIARQKRVLLLAPIQLFVAGAAQGYVQGVWMAAAVARSLGPQYVGYCGAVYSIASAVGSRVWGRLAQRPDIGRRKLFVLAFAVVLAWLVVVAWTTADAPAPETGEGGSAAAGAGSAAAAEGEAGAEDVGRRLAILLLGVAAFAAVDPVWQSLTPATLQTFFPAPGDLPCAMAAHRLFSAVGFALQQVASLVVAARAGRPCVSEQAWALVILTLLSAASTWWLHTRVCSIDHKPTPAPLAGDSPPATGAAGASAAPAAGDAAAVVKVAGSASDAGTAATDGRAVPGSAEAAIGAAPPAGGLASRDAAVAVDLRPLPLPPQAPPRARLDSW